MLLFFVSDTKWRCFSSGFPCLNMKRHSTDEIFPRRLPTGGINTAQFINLHTLGTTYLRVKRKPTINEVKQLFPGSFRAVPSTQNPNSGSRTWAKLALFNICAQLNWGALTQIRFSRDKSHDWIPISQSMAALFSTAEQELITAQRHFIHITPGASIGSIW